MDNSQIQSFTTPNEGVQIQRQDFGGGSGVFSNFFDELAVEEPCRKTNAEDLILETKDLNCDLDGLYNSSDHQQNPVFPKQTEFFINDSLDQNPRLNLYESGEDHEHSSFFTDNRIDHNENQLFLNYTNRKKQPKILINRYLLGSTFGRGSYGKVKDCLDLQTYRRLAVKIVSKHAVRKIAGGWSQAINEAAILLKLPPSRHIVRLIQPLYLKDPERICLIMEYCLGSIHDLQSSGVPASCTVPEKATSSTLDRLKNRGPMIRIATEPAFDNVQMHSEQESVFHHKEDQNFHHRPAYPAGGQTSQFRRLTEAQTHAYFLQIVSGISYLHSQRVIHRDIKPGNLLLTTFPGCGLDPLGIEAVEDTSMCSYGSSWTLEEILFKSRGYLVKITDFGVSTTLAPHDKRQMVPSGQMTLAIQPPEVAKGEVSEFNGPKLDIYSAGVSLFFMITGHVPYSTPNVLQMLDVIVNGTLVIPGHVSVDATNLINAMMQKDPSKRITLEEIWKQPWITNPPRPHPTKEQAMKHSQNYWKTHDPSHVNETSVQRWKLHGYPIWIEPLEYLCRPQESYPLPHIDGTGTRIFSAAECEEYFSRDQVDRDRIIHNSAPFTTLSRFSTFLEAYTEDATLKQSEVHPSTSEFIHVPGEVLLDNSELLHHLESTSSDPFRALSNTNEEPEENLSKKFFVFNLGHSLNEEDEDEGLVHPTRCRHHSSIVTENLHIHNAQPDDIPIDESSDQQKTAMTLNSLTKNQFQRLIKRLESQNHVTHLHHSIVDSTFDPQTDANSFSVLKVSGMMPEPIPRGPNPSQRQGGGLPPTRNRRITTWLRNKFRNALFTSNSLSSRSETLHQVENPFLQPHSSLNSNQSASSLTELDPTKKAKRKPSSLLAKASFRRGNNKDKN